ncbi:hypothetical protein K435DRAFT_962297 [Dendrothele bispora CBS 962.96]|uniref:WW domain-containing protein n=1 Tax=Dendrothele bispora (strain CBS 962.96) TaxID=1314807 RepID=A0A4S8MN23_DENBC|nr:hypothetical protein K435DRAFT_962297 [Dendrothele bispora CBS 962.96]
MSMIALQWLLKALRRPLYDRALRSSLSAILSLWNFLKLQLRKIGRNKKGSEKLNDKPKPKTVYSDGNEKVVGKSYQPPAESSIAVCASHVPDSPGHLPFDHGSSNPSLPGSSRDVQTSSLHPEDSLPRPQTLSRSHISYPNVTGHARGRNAARTGGRRTHLPASTPRLSIHDHSLRAPSQISIALSIPGHNPRTHSPISIGASNRPASPAQAVVPIAQAPISSHELSHISIVARGGRGGRGGRGVFELRDIHPHFYPTLPEYSTRYDATGTVPRESLTYIIPHSTQRFEEEQPEGWKRFTHPEGARYFFHPDKKVYTDANILDADVLSEIETAMTEFSGFCADTGLVLPSSTNLVLDVELAETSDDRCIYKYYLVDHVNRSIFWLDELAFNEEFFAICYEVKGVSSSSHIRHHIEQQYWFHCHLFPTSLTLTIDLVDELRDILMHWISGKFFCGQSHIWLILLFLDSFTSATSTAPYNVDQLRVMLSLAKNFRKNTESGGCVSAYSRLMVIFCHHRFAHFYGQPVVRLDLDRSVYDSSGSGPYIIWVDRLIHQVSWEKFINGMRGEWQELLLFGTVLINANVAFLAIQSVDSTSPARSPAQIGSYLSRVNPKESAQHVANYLGIWIPDDHGRNESRIGLETLAILYSVPYALLMWGQVFDLPAFFGFQG